MVEENTKLQEILTEHLVTEILGKHVSRSVEPEDDLLGSGLVDSLGMMQFIGFIEKRFGIDVAPEDQVIENFMTIDAISRYIQSKQTAG
jgi:acyl carrier protein